MSDTAVSDTAVSDAAVSDTDGDQLTDELIWLEDGRRVALRVDETLYPLDAIYGAAYLFVDRCWLFLSRADDKLVEVRLKPKEETSPDALAALAGEFANELLNQVLRVRVGDSTRKIREYYMARAFFSTSTQSSIDQLLAELDEEDLAEDDLEISVPWDAPAEPAADQPAREDAGGD